MTNFITKTLEEFNKEFGDLWSGDELIYNDFKQFLKRKLEEAYDRGKLDHLTGVPDCQKGQSGDDSLRSHTPKRTDEYELVTKEEWIKKYPHLVGIKPQSASETSQL